MSITTVRGLAGKLLAVTAGMTLTLAAAGAWQLVDNVALAQDDTREITDPYNCETNPDADGDGVWSTLCGGADCDDYDADRYPGNTEICNAGKDEDCDPKTGGISDHDNDGYNDWNCY